MFCHIFQKLGREIICQLKDQKKKGKTGPLKLQKVAKKPKKSVGGDGSDSDDDKKFTNITAQLAWEKDIDLTKGQAFTNDPNSIENTLGRGVRTSGLANNVGGHHTPDKKFQTEEHTHIPNGNANSARTVRKFVKKPNGTPKTSPKTFHKQFSSNRVTPLPLDSRDSDGVDSAFVNDGDDLSLTHTKHQSGRSSSSDMKSSMLDTRRTTSSIKLDLDHFVVTADSRFVSNISQGATDAKDSPSKDSLEQVKSDRAESADSRAMYDQWVDEIIGESRESSPSKSDTGSPSHRHHKSKKRKKEKKDKKEKDRETGKSTESAKDTDMPDQAIAKKRDKSTESTKKRERSKSSERKQKKHHRVKSPTSDEQLLADSDEPFDESEL